MLLYEARNFCYQWQLWIRISGCIRTQVFPRRIFSVPEYKWASIIFSRCLSSSSSGSGLPTKSNTRQPGVSRPSRWSPAKWRCPWKFRIISYPPWVRTDTSFGHTLQENLLSLFAASVGPVTKNWASSPTAYPFFILKVRLERTRLRGWSTSVSSPLVSVVSGTRCSWSDMDGPWLSLPNISSSSDNKKTHGQTKELRSHTEQFRITYWSLMDLGADFSPLPPESNKEALADVLWTEWGKTKDLRVLI